MRVTIIGGDMNNHIGWNNNNYERMHGGFPYGVGNEGGDMGSKRDSWKIKRVSVSS